MTLDQLHLGFDPGDYDGAPPLPPGRSVMSISLMSPDMRAAIGTAVMGPKPPRRWLNLGLAEIPSRAWYEWHWHRGIDPERKRTHLNRYQRARIIARDGYVCALCGGEVEPSDVHIDHVFPVALGGKDVDDNLQVAHSLCNVRKGARF